MVASGYGTPSKEGTPDTAGVRPDAYAERIGRVQESLANAMNAKIASYPSIKGRDALPGHYLVEPSSGTVYLFNSHKGIVQDMDRVNISTGRILGPKSNVMRGGSTFNQLTPEQFKALQTRYIALRERSGAVRRAGSRYADKLIGVKNGR